MPKIAANPLRDKKKLEEMGEIVEKINDLKYALRREERRWYDLQKSLGCNPSPADDHCFDGTNRVIRFANWRRTTDA